MEKTKSSDMRNSSTCFGRLTILRNAILNPLVFIQQGIEFGITLGISSLKFAPTHSDCHELLGRSTVGSTRKYHHHFVQFNSRILVEDFVVGTSL